MEKSPEAFRTISEVADWLETPAHVLRFWESKFAQVKPIKRAGGRRYYRPADMALLGGLKRLLHEDGLSIKDAQSLIREQGVKHVSALSPPLDGEVAGESDVIEATAQPAAEKRREITGLAPPGLRVDEQLPADIPAEDVASEAEHRADDTTDDPEPELPFLHRTYEERLPQASADREPMLRRASEALDTQAGKAQEAEPAPRPEPEAAPLPVARLAELRRAVAGLEPGTSAGEALAARLADLRATLAGDRTA